MRKEEIRTRLEFYLFFFFFSLSPVFFLLYVRLFAVESELLQRPAIYIYYRRGVVLFSFSSGKCSFVCELYRVTRGYI